VYVAGHRGLVGSALCRLLSSRGYKHLITRTRADLDLTVRELWFLFWSFLFFFFFFFLFLFLLFCGFEDVSLHNWQVVTAGEIERTGELLTSG
jgi:hypothetical protein